MNSWRLRGGRCGQLGQGAGCLGERARGPGSSSRGPGEPAALAGSAFLRTSFQHDATRLTSLRDVHHDGFRGHRGRRWYRGDRGEWHHRDA